MKPLWKHDAGAVAGSPFEPGRHHEVLVVGAGITGLCTALMLARVGRQVAVVDAGGIGNLATGSNTGKLSLLQGSVLSTLRRHHPAALVRAYLDANRDGADWLVGFLEEAGVPFSRRTAYTYAQSAEGVPSVRAEEEAAREAGLDVRRVSATGDEGFEIAAAIALEGQVALDPQATALALARALLAAGGTVHTGVRVVHVHAAPRAAVETTAGFATADHLVLATAAPLTDRGLYFAKTRGLRSLCVAFDVPGAVPDGLYLSVDAPSRSLRSLTPADGPMPDAGASRLIVGGNGHPVGRAESERALVEDIVAWTRLRFAGAEPVTAWSAQDYESHDLIPFVGAMPRTLGRIRFATGFGKWGLSNGPAAALRLTAEITRTPRRDRPEWMNLISRRLTVPADIGRGGVENLRVGWQAASGWAGAQRQAVPVDQPAEGEGVIAHRGAHPVGISTVDGVTRAVSAVCPHLGGVLRWNDAECTWDCPLHASRFTADGIRIEGPAVRDLARLPRSGAPERR